MRTSEAAHISKLLLEDVLALAAGRTSIVDQKHANHLSSSEAAEGQRLSVARNDVAMFLQAFLCALAVGRGMAQLAFRPDVLDVLFGGVSHQIRPSKLLGYRLLVFQKLDGFVDCFLSVSRAQDSPVLVSPHVQLIRAIKVLENLHQVRNEGFGIGTHLVVCFEYLLIYLGYVVEPTVHCVHDNYNLS